MPVRFIFSTPTNELVFVRVAAGRSGTAAANGSAAAKGSAVEDGSVAANGSAATTNVFKNPL